MNRDVTFPFDTLNVPRFYTLNPDAPVNPNIRWTESDFLRVFAVNGVHFSPEHVVVGYASLQTPFGQGTYIGLRPSDLLEAEPIRVTGNLLTDHPQGPDFRPSQREAAFYIGRERSRQLINAENYEEHNRLVNEAHEEIMGRWEEITRAQIDHALLALFADDELSYRAARLAAAIQGVRL